MARPSGVHSPALWLALRTLVVVAAVALAAAPRGARAFTWEACDADASPPFAASDVALSPDPPVIGGGVAFTIKATAGARG